MKAFFSRMTPTKYVGVCLAVCAVGLLAVALYSRDPVHFFKWFFGFVADD